MVFVFVDVAKGCLEEDESLAMLQKKSGRDVCDNHFGNIRSQGSKTSAITAQQLTARGRQCVPTLSVANRKGTLAMPPKDTGKMN
jgi:hypothetical protein